jgi:hypothetical protein
LIYRLSEIGRPGRLAQHAFPPFFEVVAPCPTS